MYSRTSNGRVSGVPSPQNIRGVPLEGNHPKQSRDERRRTVRLLHQYVPKVQARGEWPSGLGQDPDDVQEYIDRYFKNEGVSLDGEKIKKNPGLGALAKLCLNSFWGKFGQRLNLKQSQFYHETEADAFFRVLSDPTKEVQNFHIVANDTYDSGRMDLQEGLSTGRQQNQYLLGDLDYVLGPPQTLQRPRESK